MSSIFSARRAGWARRKDTGSSTAAIQQILARVMGTPSLTRSPGAGARAASIRPVALPGADAGVFGPGHADLDGAPGRARLIRKLPGEQIAVQQVAADFGEHLADLLGAHDDSETR